MNNIGGGSNEVDLFGGNAGNFEPQRRRETLEPNFSMQGRANVGELAQNRETMREVQGVEQANRMDPGAQNALGVATVGVAGMNIAPTEAQMAGVAPHDNRTAEEIAIDAPEVAKDGDKMEAEWTARARKAISDTRNNPNKRLVDVALLREEYMRKRFNRILGERNE